MTDKIQKKQDQEKSGFNSVTAAVAGVIIGAGVATAGAVLLKDKKNREKVRGILNNAKDQAVGYMENVQKQVGGNKGEAEKILAEGKGKVKKVID